MFDIGWTELLIVAMIALLIIGPRELPRMLRTLGNGMSKIRRMASEFQGQFNDALREAELDELRKQAEKLSSDMSSAASNPLEKVTSDIQKSIDAPGRKQQETKPESAPASGEQSAQQSAPAGDTAQPAAQNEQSAPAADESAKKSDSDSGPPAEPAPAASGGGRGA